MMSFVSRLSYRHWGIAFTGISAAVLAAVFVSQYGFGMHPCHLCLLQRIPFYVSTALGLALIAAAGNPKIARVLTVLLGLCFAAGTALAIFHVGVEYKWWTYNSGCAGNIAKKGRSAAEILAALKAAPVVRCDDRVVFLFGMTMAFYNALTSGALTLIALVIAWKKKA